MSHAWVHLVDFGLPVKVGGLWVKPGDLLHGDQRGIVSVPPEIATRVPEGLTKVEAAERKIIATCQARNFSAEKLKAVYREVRPGTY